MATRAARPAKAVQPAVEDKPKRTRNRVVRDTLDIAGISAVVVKERNEMAYARPTRGERSPQQQAVDKLVEQAFEAWVKGGKPDSWVDSVGMRLRVPAGGQYETLRYMLTRSSILFDVKVRIGRILETDGYCEFVFVVSERPRGEAAPADDPDENDEDNEADDADREDDFDAEEEVYASISGSDGFTESTAL